MISISTLVRVSGKHGDILVTRAHLWLAFVARGSPFTSLTRSLQRDSLISRQFNVSRQSTLTIILSIMPAIIQPDQCVTTIYL